MEDLIPLIIVIAISIIGAFSRKKKRQEERNITTPQHQNNRDNEFFNWLEKLGVEEDENSPIQEDIPLHSTFQNIAAKEVPVEVKAPLRETVSNKFSNFSGFITPEERENIMAREGISSIQHKKDTGDLTQQIFEDEEETKKPTIEFNLKQAVVFSEILNRKYV